MSINSMNDFNIRENFFLAKHFLRFQNKLLEYARSTVLETFQSILVCFNFKFFDVVNEETNDYSESEERKRLKKMKDIKSIENNSKKLKIMEE